jgi:hypothetical protein
VTRTRFILAAILLVLLRTDANAVGNQRDSRRGRADFAQALKRIVTLEVEREATESGTRLIRAMTTSEVRSILGEPDEARVNHERTATVFCYGVQFKGGLPLHGFVQFDERGVAEYVGGWNGTPPVAATISEQQLATSLTRIHDFVVAAEGGETDWDPRLAIATTNRLLPLRKIGILASFEEYMRVTTPLPTQSDSRPAAEELRLLARLLFDKSIARDSESSNFGRSVDRLVIVKDVPLVYRTSRIGSTPWGFTRDDLSHLRRRGVLRARPLTPPSKPFEVIEPGYRLAAREVKHEPVREWLRPTFIRQLIRLVRQVCPSEANPYLLESLDSWNNQHYQSIERKFGSMNIRWNRLKNVYERGD